MQHTNHEIEDWGMKRRYTSCKNTVEVMVHDGIWDHINMVCEHEATGRGLGEVPDALFLGREFSSFAQIKDAIAQPWPEGYKTLTTMIEQIQGVDLPMPASVRRVPRWREDSGDEVCLDRLRSGTPYWRACVRESRIGQRILTIAVAINSPGHRCAKDLFWRGACAIALAKILEEVGFAVELQAFSFSSGVYRSGNNALQIIRIKGSSDYLDLNALACATSGWYYRSAIFGGYFLTRPINQQCPTDELGYVMPVPAELLQYFDPQNPDGVVVIEDCWSFDAATAKARQVLALLSEKASSVAS